MTHACVPYMSVHFPLWSLIFFGWLLHLSAFYPPSDIVLRTKVNDLHESVNDERLREKGRMGGGRTLQSCSHAMGLKQEAGETTQAALFHRHAEQSPQWSPAESGPALHRGGTHGIKASTRFQNPIP